MQTFTNLTHIQNSCKLCTQTHNPKASIHPLTKKKKKASIHPITHTQITFQKKFISYSFRVLSTPHMGLPLSQNY